MLGPIIPNPWFDGQAEQAAEFYVALFPNSSIRSIARYPEGSPGQTGTVMTVEWELDGNRFIGINGGPQFTFDESVSFLITCADPEELDHYWNGLLADGGQESMCGWLTDRFGLSWRVVPAGMQEVLDDPDPARGQRAMAAMLTMRKLDLDALRRAAEGADGAGEDAAASGDEAVGSA